jgi:uncharacterized metal-binding protein YceD (DUF177 family)
MKIHLRQIPAQGLHRDGDENCGIPELATQDVRCAGPLHYALDLGVSSDALWANGTISQPVELRCVSCLEPFMYTIEVDPFTVHTELTGPETIDLTPFMREDILLNLPAYPHCDRHGGLICAAPSTQTDEERAAADRKAEADWSALDKLKL